MIPLAVPIAFAVLALVAWRYEARAQQAYEATLSAAEKRQFRALRRIHPLRWRAAIALKQAEAAVTAPHPSSIQRNHGSPMVSTRVLQHNRLRADTPGMSRWAMSAS